MRHHDSVSTVVVKWQIIKKQNLLQLHLGITRICSKGVWHQKCHFSFVKNAKFVKSPGFLADRCNATFGYCPNMSFVRLWRECVVTKRLQLGSCSFRWNVEPNALTLPAKLDDEIRRGPLDLGAQIRVQWFSTLQCCISATVRDSA